VRVRGRSWQQQPPTMAKTSAARARACEMQQRDGAASLLAGGRPRPPPSGNSLPILLLPQLLKACHSGFPGRLLSPRATTATNGAGRHEEGYRAGRRRPGPPRDAVARRSSTDLEPLGPIEGDKSVRWPLTLIL